MVDTFYVHKNILSFIKTRCIGLTGGLASGKSYIVSILKEQGFDCIDSDTLAKTSYLKESESFLKIIDVLKKYKHNTDNKKDYIIDCLVEDSSKESSTKLDTHLLSELFMMDRSLFKEVEKIVHDTVEISFYKIVENIRKKQEEKKENKFFFYESALLIETGWYKKMFKNILITCSTKTRIERMIQRGYPTKKVFDFLSEYQLSDEVKKKYSDIIIDSEVGKKELKDNLLKILKDNFIIL